MGAALVSAAATPVVAMAAGETDDGAPRDPLAPFNRVLFGFNAKVLDPFIVRPLVRGYRAVTPAVLRQGLRNAVGNLREPATTANALLQGRPTVAAKATGRFLINSTVGVSGSSSSDTAMRRTLGPNGDQRWRAPILLFSKPAALLKITAGEGFCLASR